MNRFPACRARRIGALLLLPIALLLALSAQAAAPKITGSPSTLLTLGQTYSFKPTATDADGNTLTFSVANKPTWASFSTSTGELSGTPFAEDVRVWSGIVISVSDGTTAVSLPAYSLTVKANANQSPTITGTPVTKLTVGVAWSFQPTARDPEGSPLTFSIRNKPTWLTFNATTGAVSGTPNAVGTWASITIIVSDGVTSASLQPAFSITAAAATPNSAPTITGTPVTSATIRVPYTFTPTARDANNDTLTFSVDNKPTWATFNTATGQFSGSPNAVGTFGNIIIRVSDGKTSTALPAFSITVLPAPTPGSVTASWLPPTQNVDGTTLVGLAGYRIRYGKSPTALSTVVTIANPGVTSSVIEGLTAGVWYFTVSAYTSTGSESAQSAVVSKTIS